LNIPGEIPVAAPLTAMFTVDCVPPFVTELIERISILTQGSRTLEEIRILAKNMA
jgi:hypothetical protein